MIAQKNRLSKKADFERIFKSGNKDYGQCFTIRFLENELDHCRFSVIVSNKFSKKAVERNKFRRRIKAVITENLSKFSRNFDILITILEPAKKLNFQETKIEFIEQLLKKKILRK